MLRTLRVRLLAAWRGFGVRPTARGWQALAAGVITLFIARLIGTTQFYQLGYALLLIPLAALVLGIISLRGLGFSRALPNARITVGSSARVDLRVSNGSRSGISKAEVVDQLPEERSYALPALPAGFRKVIEAPVNFPRRGVYELGPAEVRAADPFGLLRFVRKFGGRTEIVVYPRVHDLRGFSLGSGNVEAGSRGSVGQRGDEFAGLREYRRGDDRRHIHWKSVARTGELFVKEFALHAPQRYTVALDLRRRGLRVPEREVEDAVSAAASVLAHLHGERLPSRLSCTDRAGSATEFGVDEDSHWRAMRLLATIRADGEKNPGTLLEEREGLGEGVILILRSPGEGLAESVRGLQRAGLSVVVVALAAHTYREVFGGGGGRDREADFLREVSRLEAAGAAVRVVRHPVGVAGLAGTRSVAGPVISPGANSTDKRRQRGAMR